MVELFPRWARTHSYRWYQGFLHSMVVPHRALFAMLVMAAELYVGIALLLGFTTRLAASVALFLLANYMLAKGSTPWNASSVDAADMALCLVILVGGSGRIFGIDRRLHARYPAIPFW